MFSEHFSLVAACWNLLKNSENVFDPLIFVNSIRYCGLQIIVESWGETKIYFILKFYLTMYIWWAHIHSTKYFLVILRDNCKKPRKNVVFLYSSVYNFYAITFFPTFLFAFAIGHQISFFLNFKNPCVSVELLWIFKQAVGIVRLCGYKLSSLWT